MKFHSLTKMLTVGLIAVVTAALLAGEEIPQYRDGRYGWHVLPDRRCDGGDPQ